MSPGIDNPLQEPSYLSFPLRVVESGFAAGGASSANVFATSQRVAHVREQIAQVLFTDPGERVFLPDFGAGVSTLVFEPGNAALRALAIKRLRASLSDALQGEVDPRSLQIDADVSTPEQLIIQVSYILATISQGETHQFTVGAAGG
jgi:uncharacterized protein